MTFGKPIGQELVVNIDFAELSGKNAKDVDSLFLFCKEGWIKSVLGEYHTQKQALSRFFLGAMILSDPVLQIIRRELKRLSPDVRVETEEIKEVLISEVIKRDVVEGENADDAKKKIVRAASRHLREKSVAKPASEVATSDTASEESQTSEPPSEDSSDE